MRSVLGAVVGFVAWFAVATVLDRLLRVAWAGYAEALPTLSFSLGMMVARLAEGAVSTLAGGAVAAWIAQRRAGAVAATGVLLLVLFVPTHVMIWSKFPIWYHLTFLASLFPLTVLGGRLLPARTA